MSHLILELNSTEEAELDTLATLLQQSPTALARKALTEFIANHPVRSINAPAAIPPETKAVPAAEATPAARKFKHDHSAFGALKGKLDLDGLAISDGVEYQNRIRSEW